MGGGNVATDAGGRQYRAPKKKKRQKRERLTPAERKEIQRVVTGAGKDIARSAAVAGAQETEKAVREVRSRPRREHKRGGLLGGIEQNLDRMLDRYQDVGEPAYRFGKHNLWDDQRGTLGYLTGKYFLEADTQEKMADLAVGKAAANLLYHGETSHLPEAGLEIGSMLPVFRAGRGIVGLGRKGKKTLDVAEEVAEDANEIPTALAKARKTAKSDVKAANTERGRRLRKGLERLEKAGGGEAGEIALLKQLRGELPRTEFTDLAEGTLPREKFDDLIRQVQDTDVLREFEKRAAIRGLSNAYYKSKAPARHQIEHLERVFGSEKSRVLSEWRATSFKRIAGDIIGLPRALQTTLDVSYPMRQGLVAMVRFPSLAKHIPGSGIRPLVSEKHYQAGIKQLHNEPYYAESIGANNKARLEKVDYTELNPLDAQVREEGFPSPLAEKIPVAGHAVRASSRSFSLLGDVFRYNTYVKLRKTLERRGVDVSDPEIQDAIARLANTMNGRGDLGRLARYAPLANKLFFAPRLIKGRVDMLNPFWYAKLPRNPKYGRRDPRGVVSGVRREALQSMVHLGAFVSGTLAAGAYLLGGDVELDPRSSDFAKLQIANTRFDVAGGFQQYIRGTAQIITNETISSTTGKKTTLGEGFASPTRYDVFERFGWSKASPPAKFVHDILEGQDWKGDDIDAKSYAINMVAPLVAQDAYDLYKDQDSVKLALLGYAVSMFGVGSQTYHDTTPEKQKAKAAEKFKEWQTEAEKVWKAKGFKGPLPATLIRAYQGNEALNAAMKAKREELGVKQEDMSVRDEALATIDALVSIYPEQAKYRQSWESSLAVSDPVKIKELFIPWVRKRLGLGDLGQYREWKSEYKLSQER